MKKFLDQSKISALFLTLLFAQSCGLSGPADGNAEGQSPAPKAVSNIPFLTKEPESYQADVTVTAYIENEPVTERRYIIAKNGTEVSLTMEPEVPEKKTLLLLNGGRSIVIDHKARTISERKKGPKADELVRELTAGWLTIPPGTKYEAAGTENGETKYRVIIEGGGDSETFVYFNENLKIPVRTEIYSGTGEGLQLAFRYEISNFKERPDQDRFSVPESYTVKN